MSLQGKILRTYPLIHRPYYYNYIYVIRIKDILIIGAVDKWISPANKRTDKRTDKRTVISMAPLVGVMSTLPYPKRYHIQNAKIVNNWNILTSKYVEVI